MEPAFNRDQMLRLIERDLFLKYLWEKSDKSDRKLETMFNTYVREDSQQTRAYEQCSL
jgi:hypothetical protein